MPQFKPTKYLRIQEAAKLLGVNPMTLRRWDDGGKFKAKRHPISGYRLYLLADIKRLLARIK